MAFYRVGKPQRRGLRHAGVQTCTDEEGTGTFQATFDDPRNFTLDITLHCAEVEQVFNKLGAFDETVAIDIGSTQYYYVTVTSLGNWTVVQS